MESHVGQSFVERFRLPLSSVATDLKKDEKKFWDSPCGDAYEKEVRHCVAKTNKPGSLNV